jgi:hypothetical protein
VTYCGVGQHTRQTYLTASSILLLRIHNPDPFESNTNAKSLDRSHQNDGLNLSEDLMGGRQLHVSTILDISQECKSYRSFVIIPSPYKN